MDFLTDDSIMYGGKGWNTLTWSLLSLLYLAVSIVLWWVYYFYFKDRREQTIINDNQPALWGGAAGTFIGFCIIGFLMFWTGYKQEDSSNSTSPLRNYFVIPISWLFIGVQLGLVLSIATSDDWNNLKQEAKNKF
jgi:hypothetical protein